MVEVLRHTEVRSPGPDKQRDWAASVLASGECQLNSANGTASRSEPLCLAAPRKGNVCMRSLSRRVQNPAVRNP
jgi:hypothetical protein